MNKQQLIDQIKRENNNIEEVVMKLKDGRTITFSADTFVEVFLAPQTVAAYDKGREDERKEWE